MAVTVSVYAHTPKLFANSEITLSALKVELLNNTATFDRTHIAKTSVDSGSSATVTVTIAAPGVFTDTAHGFANGQAVQFKTTGALPTGITAGTWYYVINQATNTYQISATVGGAAITTTGTQSGVHTRTSSGVNEVYGNGWAPGGTTLTTVAVSTFDLEVDGKVNDAKLSADNVSVTATGGSIGPAFNAVIYDSVTNKPLLFISFGQSQAAGATTNFVFTWAANGILNWQNAA